MDSQLIIFIIFFLILVSMTLLIMAFAKPKQKEDITIRLEKLRNLQINEAEQAKKRDERYDKIKKEYKQFSRRINPFAQRLLNPKTEEQLKTKFIKAGNYDQESITFITNRIISGLAFAFFILLFNFINKNMNMANTVMLALVFAFLGYFFPLARLNRQIEDRQKAIFRSLPDTLDLLTVCLEAGMGINEALNKVVEKSRPSPLRDEIDRTLREIQVGNPRLQALRDMAKRVDLKELSSVVVALVQAEQMGTSLAKTLKIQSEIIREIRWQKAQELAQKAPVKLIIPVALFIFPTIFMIIFGPIVISFVLNQ